MSQENEKMFKDSRLADIWNGAPPRGIDHKRARIIRRKLEMINAAENLDDLRRPPANHLERLRGDREGQYSIRVNDQWRLCFAWRNDRAEEMELVDYH
ncbi:MAG: type II toxin-antitoxin system RelE/ParE family toxin [Candidatus Adiutrix sp.]|jgi:proteic killer suppression protein|nr:type II toxin-antitoxin system RelE/ParE family toxin [Candidatus Adiutrix sp.]